MVELAVAEALPRSILGEKGSFSDSAHTRSLPGSSSGGGNNTSSLSATSSDDAGPGDTAPSPSSPGSRLVQGGVPSARVFCAPENLRLRILMHGFIDIFKKHVEAPYTLLLKAPNPEKATSNWDACCSGLKELDDYLKLHGAEQTAAAGAFFLGDEPCMVEAATAPSLFRMIANLVRHAHCPRD